MMGGMAEVEETPCPTCGEKQLRVEIRLTARPLGTFSVAGQQMKVSAYDWPYLVCGNCDFVEAAKDPSA